MKYEYNEFTSDVSDEVAFATYKFRQLKKRLESGRISKKTHYEKSLELMDHLNDFYEKNHAEFKKYDVIVDDGNIDDDNK